MITRKEFLKKVKIRRANHDWDERRKQFKKKRE